MKYRVVFVRTTLHETYVEAASPDEAEKLGLLADTEEVGEPDWDLEAIHTVDERG